MIISRTTPVSVNISILRNADLNPDVTREMMKTNRPMNVRMTVIGGLQIREVEMGGAS